MCGNDSEQACKIKKKKIITFDFGLNRCYLKA